MNAEKKTVKPPRWHYRDVQAGMSAILEKIPEAGSLKAALVATLEPRKDKLPEGQTAETAVDAILGAVDGFVVAHEQHKTGADIRKQLEEKVSKMDNAQAMTYLAMLEATFEACDLKADGADKVPTVEEIQARVRRAAAEPGDIAARIDATVAKIEGDSLATYVFATGNDALGGLVREQGNVAAGLSPDLAERVREAMTTGVRKSEAYAAAACTVYGMILDGKVPGVMAKDADVKVMTTLVAAGMEKASILTRLVRGEIDAEMAKDLLDALVKALKWCLVAALEVATVIGMVAVVAWAVPAAFVWLITTSNALLALGLVVGIVTAVSCTDDYQGAVDFLEKAVKAVVRGIGRICAWACGRAVTAERAAVANMV